MSSLRQRRGASFSSKGEKVLRPIVPNAGIEAAYRKKILKLTDEMNASVCYWLKAAFKANEPLMAMDEADDIPQAPAWKIPEGFTGVAYGSTSGESKHNFSAYIDGEIVKNSNGIGISYKSAEAAESAVRKRLSAELPADSLASSIKKLTARWQKNFDTASRDMAEYFAKAVSQRSDFALQRILKDSGWSVEFRMTEAQRDVINATINQNVSLIKSIPQRYLGDVEGMVMRSVQSGRDLGQLTKDLQKSYGVTRRRAALIARDQNNKATSALQNARQRELGITEAIWVHSTAGKEPRPTHLANNGKRYEVAKGWYDPAVKDWIFPGQLINCRCFSRPVIKGFS